MKIFNKLKAKCRNENSHAGTENKYIRFPEAVTISLERKIKVNRSSNDVVIRVIVA